MGVDKLSCIKELHENAEEMYLTPSVRPSATLSVDGSATRGVDSLSGYSFAPAFSRTSTVCACPISFAIPKGV